MVASTAENRPRKPMSGLERTQSDIEEAARQNSTCRSVFNRRIF